MKPRLRIPPLLLLLAMLPAFGDPAAIALSHANAYAADPAERPLVAANLRPVTLPFQLAADYRCPTGTKRTQLFLSIADTVRLVESPEVAVSQTLRLDVPLKRLQWLAQPAQLCTGIARQRAPDETTADGTRLFRLHAGAAAYATVTCHAENAETAATTSAPLDVWLSCAAVTGADEAVPGATPDAPLSESDPGSSRGPSVLD